MRNHPCAHPQHMRVVKHLLCVWQWSGSHLGWFYSLNKRTTLLFAPWEIWYQYLDSTAYEGCKTFMCLTMIWMKPSWMGLQPQLPHYTVVSVAPREIPWIRQHPKACLKRLARTQKGLIHMHIHSIWMWWHVFYVFDNESGAILLDGSLASTTTVVIICSHSSLSGGIQNQKSGQLPKNRMLIVIVKW